MCVRDRRRRREVDDGDDGRERERPKTKDSIDTREEFTTQSLYMNFTI